MKLVNALLWTQGIYTLITAIWPIVHIESFMAVTGPKHDIWLVKTVGALLIPVGCCLLTYTIIQTDRRPALILGSLSALAFMVIDFYYSLNDVIADVYLVDGFLQVTFFGVWMYIVMKHVDTIKRQN